MAGNDQRNAFIMTGGGMPRGELLDPSSVTVYLDPPAIGDDEARKLFQEAIHRQQAAIGRYSDTRDAANGDVTDSAVQDAARELHESLQLLPVAHTAYAGVGFPARNPVPRRQDGDTRTTVQGAARLGVHPDMLTAIQGDTAQRWELAGQHDLPAAIEVALATDPDPQIRASFLSGQSRSRTAVLLMEQRESDPDVLVLLAQQSYASPDRKLSLVLGDLVLRELEGLFELLGFDDHQISLARQRWAHAHERREPTTVRSALREIGVLDS